MRTEIVKTCMDGEDLDGKDMDSEDMDGFDTAQKLDGDGENIGRNNGGSIDSEFCDFCNEHDMW